MVNCGIPFCWIWQNPERSYILLHYNNRIHAAGLLFLLEVLVGPLWKYLWGHFSHWWSWNCSAPTILLPCPRCCPDSSDFRGEVKKNIHWEPGANWRRPRVITWGGTAVPACWGWAVRAAAGTVALSTNCQLSPCYLCCWEVSRAIFNPCPEVPFVKGVFPWVSHCMPTQAASSDRDRCDVFGKYPGCFARSQCSGS